MSSDVSERPKTTGVESQSKICNTKVLTVGLPTILVFEEIFNTPYFPISSRTVFSLSRSTSSTAIHYIWHP